MKTNRTAKTTHNEQFTNQDQITMEHYYPIDILLRKIKRKQELGL